MKSSPSGPGAAVFCAAFLTATASAQVDWRPHPTATAGPTNAACAFYPPTQQLVAVGGKLAGQPHGITLMDGQTSVTTANPGGPPQVDGAAMAFDPTSGSLIWVGYDPQILQGQVWSFDGTTWTMLYPIILPLQGQPPLQPPPLFGHTMFTSPDGIGVYVVGGRIPTTPSTSNPNLTVYHFNGVEWRSASFPQAPVDRAWSAAATDLEAGRAILFGGQKHGVQGPLQQFFRDTWSFDGIGWSMVPATGAPAALAGASLTHDPARDRFVLVAGRGTADTQQDGVWELDGTTWIQRQPTVLPATASFLGRSQHCAAWLPLERRILIAGGQGAPLTTATQLGVWTLGPVAPAEAETVGNGCADSSGTAPELGLVDGALPWLGDPVTVTLAGGPGTPGTALVWVDISSPGLGAIQPLAQPLGPVGLPGCTLWITPNLPIPVALQGGVGALTQTVPITAGLAGQSLHAQGLVFDAGIQRPVPAAVSNALRIRLGSR